MNQKQYRAAVVGCGRIGVNMEQDPKQSKPATHAAAFSKHLDCELTALVDSDPTKLSAAGKLYPSVSLFSAINQMLEEARPHIVCVATPPAQHRPVVELCAEAGVRAIVCEKPIAEEREDARVMIEACAQNKSLLFVNHMRRFDPLIRKAREEVRSGAIGEVLQATCYYTAGIMNTGTHMLDLIRFFLGGISWVAGFRNACSSHSAGDENMDVIMEMAEGTRVMLQVCDVKDYSIFDLRLLGRDGSLLLTSFGYEVQRVGLCERLDVSGYRQLNLAGTTREGQPRSFMASLADHVVACLDGKDSPISQGKDGLAALDALTAIHASAAQGSKRISLRTGEVKG